MPISGRPIFSSSDQLAGKHRQAAVRTCSSPDFLHHAQVFLHKPPKGLASALHHSAAPQRRPGEPQFLRQRGSRPDCAPRPAPAQTAPPRPGERSPASDAQPQGCVRSAGHAPPSARQTHHLAAASRHRLSAKSRAVARYAGPSRAQRAMTFAESAHSWPKLNAVRFPLSPHFRQPVSQNGKTLPR
jgi:hypothetical protein